MATHLDFYEWVKEDFGWREDFDQLVSFDSDGDVAFFVDFKTENESYSILIFDPSPDHPEGRVSFISGSYDFTGGPITRATWNMIMADIVANELQPLRETEEVD